MVVAAAFLAFVLAPPMPTAAPAPPPIPAAVQELQRQHGITPLRIPAPDEDPVASGLIPGDLDQERERVHREIEQKRAQLYRQITGGDPPAPPVKMWRPGESPGIPDLTQTAPPATCSAQLDDTRYIDAELGTLCICKHDRWCPEDTPKRTCKGTSTRCE